MSAKPAGCKKCEKASLALLLLRPSPIAKEDPLRPPGSSVVQSAGVHALGLTPSRAPTESRTVLRLMREGYVHVYIESPPPGVKKWQVYQVTPNADLLPLGSHLDITIPPPPPCPAQEHNRAGLMLVSIPKAHLIDGVWIAFSANYWNDKLRGQNAANPKVMQYVPLAGGGKNTFKPTEANLKNHVLECALEKLLVDGGEDHDYPFVKVAPNTAELAEALRKAADHHPKTAGKELAVVLADPVAYTTELNALRSRRHLVGLKEACKPDNAWAQNSANLVNGLRHNLLDGLLKRGYDTVAPVMTQGRFKDIMRVKPNPRGWPEGTRWEPITANPRRGEATHAPGEGRVIFPDHDTRAAEWARMQSEATWEKLARYYDEAGAKAWMAAFDARMKAEHYEPLQRFELDWLESRNDARFDDCFELHFDPQDPNDLKEAHCPGATYTIEGARALTPAPLTQGPALDLYIKEIKKDLLQPSAVLLRTLASNNEPLLIKAKAVFALEEALASGGGHAHDKRNDKLFDLGSGFVLLAPDPDAPLIKAPKFKFLAPGLFGDLACAYTLLVAKSISTAGYGLAIRFGVEAFAKSGEGKQLLAKMGSTALVQRCRDLALESVVNGGPLRTPMQIEVEMRPIEAVYHMNGRFSRRQVMAATSGGWMRFKVLTDNIELAQHANVRDLVAAGAGQIEMRGKYIHPLCKIPYTERTVRIGDKVVDALRQSGTNGWARAAEGVVESARGSHAVVSSLQGRLALGVILINTVGLIGSLGDLSSDDARTFRDACVGFLDSSASVIAGSLQVIEAAAKTSINSRLGAQGVAKSVALPALRMFAAGLGAFAGGVNAYGQFMRAGDAKGGAKTLYQASGFAFAGTAFTSGLAAAGAFADMRIARGTASAVMRRLAWRYGAQGTASLLGISISGWGLILLGLAVGFEVWIMIITPTEMQKWLSRTRFGQNGDGKDPKFTSWEQEVSGLHDAFGSPPPQAVALPATAADASA